ncbi:MAG: SurA N-terminal domain-containing protein, partial [Pseudoxanthomonas sp.]
MKAISPVLLACALAAFTSPMIHAQALPAAPIDSIVAVVDEDVILRSELDLAVSNITHQIAASNQGDVPPKDVLERQVLDRLVMMRLQVNRAGDSGIRISDQELQQAVASIAQQNKMTVADLRARLEADHLSYDEFQSNLRDEVTVQRLRQRYVQSSVQISEAEIDQVLATTAVGGPEMRLANLQVSVGEGATPGEIAAAKKKIDGIKAQIERGEIDFHSAAIRYSQAQNALDGGDLGWRSGDSIPPVFAGLLRGMKPGQVTEAVRGPSGFQVVQLVETRDSQPQKLTQFHAQDIMVAVSDVVPDEVAR